MFKKRILITPNSEIKEFHDPLVYVENLPDSCFVEKLRQSNTVYEYTATSDGFTAIKYDYSYKGDSLLINFIQPYSNIPTLKLYKVESKQYRTKFMGINNFIKQIDNKSIVLSYSHDIKNPMVEKLVKLYNGADEPFDLASFKELLKSFGAKMEKLPTNIDSSNFRSIIADQMSKGLNGKRILLNSGMRDIQKFGGNDVHIDLSQKHSFITQLKTKRLGFIHHLKSYNVPVVLSIKK